MLNQWTSPPLDKCCDCQKSFSLGEEYWNLQKEGVAIVNYCIQCQNKYSLEKKNWPNTNQTNNKCNHCQKEFQQGEENWVLTNKETQQVLNTCLLCQNKHTFTKKTWKN